MGSRELAALRCMAWERAKGELQSMTQTYYEEDDGGKFDGFTEAMEKFIKLIEGHGYQE